MLWVADGLVSIGKQYVSPCCGCGFSVSLVYLCSTVKAIFCRFGAKFDGLDNNRNRGEDWWDTWWSKSYPPARHNPKRFSEYLPWHPISIIFVWWVTFSESLHNINCSISLRLLTLLVCPRILCRWCHHSIISLPLLHLIEYLLIKLLLADGYDSKIIGLLY